MSGREGVSIMIIARDEAARIERCLRSAAWADEIVVIVDAATTDGTAELARRYTPHVHTVAFRDFASQRQVALEHAREPWGLWMDCDEIVTPELAAGVRSVLANPTCAAYRVARRDRMFGRWIRHGGWYPQYHVRLFRRAGVRWEGAVHERLRISGPIGVVPGDMEHHSHATVEDWVAKMVRYTAIEGREWHAAGRRVAGVRILVEPLLYFAYKYILQQGWRDGVHGLVLAMLMGCYRQLILMRVWDLQRRAR